MTKNFNNFSIPKEYLENLCDISRVTNQIDGYYYDKYNVKRGLRNQDGTGVLVGLTSIGEVSGYIIADNEKEAVPGKLIYRGVDIRDIVEDVASSNRHGFEEVIFLLLFGILPTQEQLAEFKELIGILRLLPDGFTEDMILKTPCKDIMIKLSRSVLALYSYDDNPDDTSVLNVLKQSIELIAKFPTLAAYAYQAKSRYFDGKSLYLHTPKIEFSTAESFLYMLRPDNKFTKLEADILDLMLILHAEHGGGNNSTFAAHVVTSSGTDIYSAVAAAIGSLKGPKHGGANAKVTKMARDIMEHVENWENDDEIAAYLEKIVRTEAFDRTGLIYGMGHAVYTISDPRAELLREKARELAKERGALKELSVYEAVERLGPEVLAKVKGGKKDICANVDLYSGFVYQMLNIPQELCTPLFAVSRVVGWCAHILEENIAGGRIIRPAYKSVSKRIAYTPLEERE